MKGQFTWDYIVSIVAFIVLVTYIMLQVVGSVPGTTNSIRNEYLRSEAYQLSELLINDPGEPRGWTLSTVKRIGLANESYNFTNYLSARKIGDLNSLCSNYNSLVGNLSIDITKYNVSIIILSRTESGTATTAATCKPLTTITRMVNITMKRYAVIDNGNYAELILQVW